MLPITQISDKINIENGLLEVVARLSRDKGFKRFTDYIIQQHVDISIASTRLSGSEGMWAQGAAQMLEILMVDITNAEDILTKIITDRRAKDKYISSLGKKQPHSRV